MPADGAEPFHASEGSFVHFPLDDWILNLSVHIEGKGDNFIEFLLSGMLLVEVHDAILAIVTIYWLLFIYWAAWIIFGDVLVIDIICFYSPVILSYVVFYVCA